MNEEEILHKMRAVFQDCQKQALALTQQHPSIHKGFVADMQFASTYGAFLAEVKINHGVDLEKDSIAQKLVDALAKTDSHAIGLLREEIYIALDQMQPEHYASYIFLTCFPSIYKAMGEK
jgi:phenylpyruvate tautomerase PptA (4-oxalocrotonate tautomerase family)